MKFLPRILVALFLAPLLGLTPLAHAAAPEGAREFVVTMATISDGDTATFIVADGPNRGTKLRTRFGGIDCPEVPHKKGEPGQPFGREALAAAKTTLTNAGQIRLLVYDQDRYGRQIGLIYADGQLVNAQLVQDGLAYVYRDYLKKLPRDIVAQLDRAETEAKRARRGVWSDPKSENPAAYRRRNAKGGG